MPFSSIMVHVTPTSPASSRVRLAAVLADRLGAHLIGVAARPANLVAFNGYGNAVLADRLGAHLIGVAARPPNLVAFNDYGNLDERLIKHELKLAGDEVGRAENVFKEATGACKTSEWRSTIGWPTPFLIEQARAADLIVVAREDKSVREEGRFSLDLGDVLMEAGRPLLIAPPGLESLAAERVVIAWKNTREARRALRDSLPILKLAKEITVATIRNDGEDAGIDDVRAFLRCHGVAAAAYRSDKDDDAAAAQILSLAKKRGADLIVAGGYGHSRMREWILGGVTRSFLEQARICCLMSH
jgi:nucleotide-binding universal stress UspA family protein